jgi:Flp pilus assembly protein TadD
MKHNYFLTILIFFMVSARSQDTVKVATNLTPDQIAEQDYNNGLAALKKNEFTGAVDLFTKALTLKPNFDKALANRAIANTRLKQHSAAISDINSAIKINAQNPEFYFNKSLIFYDLNQKDSEWWL